MKENQLCVHGRCDDCPECMPSLKTVTALKRLREVLGRIPVRHEPISGQMFTYIKRSEVFDWLDIAIAQERLAGETTAKQWRCFHCDEVITGEVDARAHFGNSECSEPACRIKVSGEFALLHALRNAENELARYRAEDSDILRAMHSQAADHAQALRREEEKGYARGLEDAKKHPETLGLVRVTS